MIDIASGVKLLVKANTVGRDITIHLFFMQR